MSTAAQLKRSPRACLAVVAELLDTTPDQIITGRGRRMQGARWLAMYAARQHTSSSYVDIGIAFQVHYTTVIYACKKLAAQIENDPSMAQLVDDISTRIEGGAK